MALCMGLVGENSGGIVGFSSFSFYLFFFIISLTNIKCNNFVCFGVHILLSKLWQSVSKVLLGWGLGQGRSLFWLNAVIGFAQKVKKIKGFFLVYCSLLLSQFKKMEEYVVSHLRESNYIFLFGSLAKQAPKASRALAGIGRATLPVWLNPSLT